MQHKLTQLLLIVLLLLSGNLLAQNLKLTGTVKDPKGEPLIGANVFWKENTSYGTQTDANGTFALEVPATEGTLVYSYVGYNNQEEPFSAARTTLDATLTEQKALDETANKYAARRIQEFAAASQDKQP